MRAILLLALAACALAQTPPRPDIPEEFMAVITFQTHELNKTYDGEGHWAHDQTGGMSVEDFMVKETGQERPMHEVRLFRYDEKEEFEVNGPPSNETCKKTALSGTLEPAFGWLAEAKYVGKKEIRHQTFDEWVATVGGITTEMLVDAEAPNEPAFLSRRGTHGDLFMDFHEFKSGTPPADVFTVPKECAQH